MSVLAPIFLFCTLAEVVFGHSDYVICNESHCMTCSHCSHSCLLPLKMTCYVIIKRGEQRNGGRQDCFCQPESYCDSFYSCHNWHCPSPGLMPVCNPRIHSCTCVPANGTCSGSDTSSCHMTCNSHEKMYCDHGICSCKPVDYCDHDNADCANFGCRTDLGEVPFCNAHHCQCGLIVDRCNGNDVSTCQHLHCDGLYPERACISGECKCQLNPSCSSSLDCTETNTLIEFPQRTVLQCKSLYNLYPDCRNGRCQCFPRKETTTSVMPTTPKTTATSPSTTTTTTTLTITTTPIATTTTRTPSLTPTVPTTSQAAATHPHPTPTACVSESDCDNSNTFYELYSLRIPCPPGDAQCVNNSCFCNPFKDTTIPQTTSRTTAATPQQHTTVAASRYCHQCGDPASNTPCDLRMVFLGNLQKCVSGNFCMTDVIQTNSTVSIYKRCVDELTCLNEWMAQTSDQDRCLRYAEGAVPGQYTCHYCCTTDGCNSNMVPDAKTFYVHS